MAAGPSPRRFPRYRYAILRVPVAERRCSRVYAHLQSYLRTNISTSAVRVGPFWVTFDEHDDNVFLNYAIPDDGHDPIVISPAGQTGVAAPEWAPYPKSSVLQARQGELEAASPYPTLPCTASHFATARRDSGRRSHRTPRGWARYRRVRGVGVANSVGVRSSVHGRRAPDARTAGLHLS